MRAITLFTGGGGVDVALQAAGYEVVAGLEYDAAIAAIANANLGGHVRVGDILKANPADFPACDLLHASPPCPSFSVAKAGGKETDHDIAMAEKVAEFIEVLLPWEFTMENVQGYRKSQSYGIIINKLLALGYVYDARVLNSADFGVPQTRKRLIVRATRRGYLPDLPAPVKWIGWYEAIEDLLDTLPESKFANWQLKRLPEGINGNFASDMQNVGRDLTTREGDEPFPTVCATAFRRPISEPKAFLMRSANSKQQWGKGYHLPDEPTMTIGKDAAPKAFLAGVQGENGDLARQPETPSPTITSAHSAEKYRAFLANESSSMEIREPDAPSASQVASGRNLNQKAFIVPGGNQSARAIQEEEPMFTIGSANRVGNIPRAWLSQGRVVKMTTRCLARFQSFPDTYELSSNNALDCKIIGNACPPLMMQRIFEGFIR